MRCNNDIKNYFNLYLKEKTSVFSENCYLRSGYDLAQLLQAEPDEVMQRRQRLEAEKVRPAGWPAGRQPGMQWPGSGPKRCSSNSSSRGCRPQVETACLP